MKPVIGVDFDNTLVTYDHLMHAEAMRLGLIGPDVLPNKKDVRDSIRMSPNGDLDWQKLQAIVYGPKLGMAKLIKGVQPFFDLCKQHQIDVYVVSHKTRYAKLDPTKTNLREAALTWMGENRFFDAAGLGISAQDVYFEPTRQEKINRISSLGCTHFIDDLEETFLEDSFPSDIEKILFSGGPVNPSLSNVKVAGTWTEITDHLTGTVFSC